MSRFCPEKYLGEIFWDVESGNGSGLNQQPRVDPFRVSNSTDVDESLVEFMKRSSPAEENAAALFEKERSFRHRINERMRRQRHKQGCLALHSLLPKGTKSDASSIIQTATKEIQRLQEQKHVLLTKRDELEAASVKPDEGSMIQLRVLNPTSLGLDSMIDTLKCLKSLGVDTKNIKSSFSSDQDQPFGVFDIETMHHLTCEVERLVHHEVERKLLSHFDEGMKK